MRLWPLLVIALLFMACHASGDRWFQAALKLDISPGRRYVVAERTPFCQAMR